MTPWGTISKRTSTCARVIMFLYYTLQQAPRELHPDTAACASLENSVMKCPCVASETVLLSLLGMEKLTKWL